jgi:protein phosphatase
VMSRFAADPRWLMYLPPTMAPPATSKLDGYLEHPLEAFEQFRSIGVDHVLCEEKHMGSRAVVLVGRSQSAIAGRFGIDDPSGGLVTTRTGRPFFNDSTWNHSIIDRVRCAVTATGLWDELATDWLLIDAELLPWSAKAEDLLRRQYAAVGASATASLGAATDLAGAIASRLANDPAAAELLTRVQARSASAARFVDAYRRYCWDVAGPNDLQLAPFQILAAEGEVLAGRDHVWHLAIADRLRA